MKTAEMQAKAWAACAVKHCAFHLW